MTQEQQPPIVDPYARTVEPPRGPKARWRTLALVTTLSLSSAGLGAIGALALTRNAHADEPQAKAAIPVVDREPTPRGPLSNPEVQTTTLFKDAAPSVVFITKLEQRRGRFRLDATTIPAGTGSGFVWDDQGHIVTNFHVIRGGTGAKVTLSDGSSWPAKLVGTAVDKDIAVLRIEAPSERLPPLRVGTSDDLEVGQHVLAIGNPFGLDHTLSTGVISGLGREIKSVAGNPITGVIQTDAAINPGNSGGPLLDSAGRLIGMNTAIFSPSGASAGIGFAVPVDTVRRIVPQLIAKGQVERPGLGIEFAHESLARRLGVEGVLVMNVMEGSGAAEAGLRPTRRESRDGTIALGDVIVELDGAPIDGPNDLFRALDGKKVGDEVALTVIRDGKREQLDVKLVDLRASDD